MKKSLISTISVLSLLLVSGCASYKATHMSPMLTYRLQDANKGITIIAKKFDKQDCKRYLDRDVISKGYLPIQLCIQNNTTSNYMFSLDRVGLVHANASDVAKEVHTSTVGRAAGYGIGGLFLWPLLIPAVVDGIKSSEANEALDRDFLDKSASDQIISAHSYFNKLIFVPSSQCPNTFSLTLVDVATGQLDSFVVSLDNETFTMTPSAHPLVNVETKIESQT